MRIKDEIAKKKGYKDWDDLLATGNPHWIDKCCDEYASFVAHLAIEEAAEEVTAFCKDDFGYPMPATVDKQSILKLKEKY